MVGAKGASHRAPSKYATARTYSQWNPELAPGDDCWTSESVRRTGAVVRRSPAKSPTVHRYPSVDDAPNLSSRSRRHQLLLLVYSTRTCSFFARRGRCDPPCRKNHQNCTARNNTRTRRHFDAEASVWMTSGSGPQ